MKMVDTAHKMVSETTQLTSCTAGEALPALTSFWGEHEGVTGAASQSQGCLRTRETGGGVGLPGQTVQMAAWGGRGWLLMLGVVWPSWLVLGKNGPDATCALKPGYCQKVVYETHLHFKEVRWFSSNIRSRILFFFFTSCKWKHTEARKAVYGGKGYYPNIYAAHQVTVLLFLFGFWFWIFFKADIYYCAYRSHPHAKLEIHSEKYSYKENK